MAEKRVLIIAEAGVNHNGSLDLAFKLVDAASAAHADIVKFQTFKSEKLVAKSAKQAEYQSRNTGVEESQLQMLKRLELSESDHEKLLAHCKSRGIEFLSTPFDLDSVALLADRFKLKRLKVSSGDLSNAPILLEIARRGLPVIISTGMSTLEDVKQALGVLAFGYRNSGEAPSIAGFEQAFASVDGAALLDGRVTILHCTTEYPAPFAEVNLKAMETLRQTFRLPVGFSDHTPGIAMPIAAVALGAQVIEKHFTLERGLPGPDHKASLEPGELKAMVEGIRQTEVALGTGTKEPTSSELKNMAVARKSLVAARSVKKGEVFTEQNLTVKRPGSGISPLSYWETLGKQAPRDFSEDEVVEL